MMPLDNAASRLCTACGLCCNGVLFHIVKLQPADSIGELTAAGLQINRKKRGPYFNQPCSQLHDRVCGIYEQRPQRCRLFECRQLQLVAAQAITEVEARACIDAALALVAETEALLAAAGDDRLDLPLAERCAIQGGASADAMRVLAAFLDQHFRARSVASPSE